MTTLTTHNVVENSRNLYTADLNFTDNKAVLALMQSDTECLATFNIYQDGDDYEIELLAYVDAELYKRLKRRQRANINQKQLDTSLRGIQYWVRKLAEDGAKTFNLDTADTDGAPTQQPVKTVKKNKPVTPFTDTVDDAQLSNLKANKKDKPADGIEDMINNLVYQSIESDDAKEILINTTKRFLDAHGIVPGKVELEIRNVDTGEVKNLGIVHNKFKTVLTAIKAGCNVALVGPAGSGKTTVVKNAAEALGLSFASKSVSAQTGTHEFFGYQDANGNYVPTLFREQYEKGGVFLVDEYDAGNPNVLAALNQATANEVCAFADGMITKHKDFICVMAGNTFGHGATTEYVGRNQIDAATLDRFVFIDFPYDEDFEYQLAPNKDWCKKVQKLRAIAVEKKIRTVISPRATFDGSKLLAAGMKENEVLALTILKGLPEEEKRMLKG